MRAGVANESMPANSHAPKPGACRAPAGMYAAQAAREYLICIYSTAAQPETMNFLTACSNIFFQHGERPHVFVEHGQGPYANTRAALAHFNLATVRGKKVLLKPNAGRAAAPGEGITTDPGVVAAAIDAFQAAGATVAVGESPITGVKAYAALEETGIAAAARARGCALIDLDARPPVVRAIPGARALAAIKICAEVLEYDVVVSLPVMKMHMHTGVTLSVKNMKGCLWRRSKVDLHMLPAAAGSTEKPLNIAIADLSGVLRPHLAVIDGTVGMEGMGPSAGTPKALDVVVAGADPFAADAVACALMGVAADQVAHLSLGAERGYGVIDLDTIEVVPGNWRDRASAFEPAPANIDIEFPGIEILDRNSCSACQSTLLLFLKQYGSAILDYFPAGSTLSIAIGSGHVQLADGTICLGNCTAVHRGAHCFVAGCPPVGSEILKAITGRTSLDSSKVNTTVKE